MHKRLTRIVVFHGRGNELESPQYYNDKDNKPSIKEYEPIANWGRATLTYWIL